MSAFALPGIAYAIDLLSAGAFRFDIAETTTGALANGTIDTYDTAYSLNVNGSGYTAGGMAATTSLGGRQLEMAEVSIGALRVKRLVYVPMTGGDYARYLDVVSNPGATDVAAMIRINGNLGSDSGTLLATTASGDAMLTVADTWFSTDDLSDGAGDTSSAHVVHGGPGSRSAPATLTLTADNFEWRFDVTVPAGGRVAVLTFAIQGMNRAMSQAEAARVAALPMDTLDGLETYYGDIVNFPVGGAPVVRFTSPSTANESEEIVVEAEVLDLDGDTPTWSWDLDGDGTFGELPDMTTYTIPAGTTDGPSTIALAIEATDGTNSRIVTRTIEVFNVEPAIVSDPPLTAAVRREYRYEVMIDDPAGDLDPPAVLLVSRPGGMEIEGNVITWTPMASARGMSFPAAIRVNDGDLAPDDAVEQRWMIEVANNTAPTAPTPVSPIERARVQPEAPVDLVVMNGMDLDGDPLVYEFQVARTSSFEGASLQGSGEVPEGAGMTMHTLPSLAAGLWYWRAWVSDGIDRSPEVNATLWVGAGATGADAAGPDGGPPTMMEPPDDGGCGCRADGGGGSWIALALLGLWLFFPRGLRPLAPANAIRRGPTPHRSASPSQCRSAALRVRRKRAK